MISELFSKTECDNCSIIKKQNRIYTFKEVKIMIANKIEQIKNCSENIVILPDDNFAFFINFFASVFTNKKIYLLQDTQKVKEFKTDFYIPDSEFSLSDCNYAFPKLSSKDIVINFFTSGSTSEPQIIKKTLANLLDEGIDVTNALNLADKNFIVKSSTTCCHLFGMTFGFIFPLINRYLIDTERVLYPENINNENCFFVSTPSFLSALKKHSLPFAINPNCIIAAGAKLEDDLFEYFEKNSSVIEIYGSTETGVIAYRISAKDKALTVFPNVNFEKGNKIKSKYIYGYETIISDNIQINGDKISVSGRKDRVLKIYDKRVSLDAMEYRLNANEFVEKSYCFEFKNKLACLCSLTENGKQYLLENGINELKKYLKKYLNAYFDVIPQKIRFNFIPMTQTGKIDKSFINKLFAVNFSFPIILKSEITLDTVVYQIFFDKSCNFYNGHFPDFPITPGVVQLYIASELASHYFKIDTSVGQIRRMKFTNIIYPNSIINLSLTKTENGIEYAFYDEMKKYSLGILPVKNIFKGEL